MNNPLISIIVPVYNVEKYINKCLESILNQTYKNLEVILVDDGSPDNCPKICDEYEAKDKRIHVIHKKNGGVSSARNTGLKIATGDYITFVDPDDYIDVNTYEKIINILNESEIDALRYNVVEEKGDELKYPDNIFGTGFVDKEELFKLCLEHKMPGWSCVWIFRKELLINDLKFPEQLKICEDLVFVIELICVSNKIYFYNNPLYHYITNMDGASRNPDKLISIVRGYIDLYGVLGNVLNKHELLNEQNDICIATSVYNHIVWLFNKLIKYNLVNDGLDVITNSDDFSNMLKKVNRKELKPFNKIFLTFINNKKMLALLCKIKGYYINR